MGYDVASVIIHGVLICSTDKAEDQTAQMEVALRKLFPDLVFDSDFWCDGVFSLGKIQNADQSYSVKYITHCDVESALFIVLRQQSLQILRSCEAWPKKIQEPTPDQIREFTQFLRSKGIEQTYDVYHCLEGSN